MIPPCLHFHPSPWPLNLEQDQQLDPASGTPQGKWGISNKDNQNIEEKKVALLEFWVGSVRQWPQLQEQLLQTEAALYLPHHQERLTVNGLGLRIPKWLHQEVLTPTNHGRTVPSSSANSFAEVCSNRFSSPRNLDLLIPFWDELVTLNCAFICTYSCLYFPRIHLIKAILTFLGNSSLPV